MSSQKRCTQCPHHSAHMIFQSAHVVAAALHSVPAPLSSYDLANAQYRHKVSWRAARHGDALVRLEHTLKRDGSVCISLTRRLSPMRVAMLQCCTVGVKSTLRTRDNQYGQATPQAGNLTLISYYGIQSQRDQGEIWLAGKYRECHMPQKIHTRALGSVPDAHLTIPSSSFTVIASSLTTFSCSRV